MVPPTEKRGHGVPNTPSPPSSHKRVRSTEGIDNTSKGPGTPNSGSFLPPFTAGFNYVAPVCGTATRQRPIAQAASLAAQRIQALAEAYPCTQETSKTTSYTPAHNAAQETGYGAGGSSRNMPVEMKMAGVPLKSLGLGLPLGLEEQDAKDRARDLEKELEFQARYPPCLPPSDVPELAPKSTTDVLIPVPEDATREERHQIEIRNNVIALTNKAKDRERNNQAAKKSRELRIESLARTKTMLLETTAEVNWLRLRLLASGDKEALAVWEALRRSGMVLKLNQEVNARVDAIEFERADEKKRRDSVARVNLNKERSMARAASSQRMSKDRELSLETETLRKSDEFSTMEPLHRMDAAPAATPSRVFSYDGDPFVTPQHRVMNQYDYTPDLSFSYPSTISCLQSSGPASGSDPFISDPIYEESSPANPFAESPAAMARRRQLHSEALFDASSANDDAASMIVHHPEEEPSFPMNSTQLSAIGMPPGYNMGSQFRFPDPLSPYDFPVPTMPSNNNFNRQRSGQQHQQYPQYQPEYMQQAQQQGNAEEVPRQQEGSAQYDGNRPAQPSYNTRNRERE